MAVFSGNFGREEVKQPARRRASEAKRQARIKVGARDI
jgi:hypothetical protein